MIPGTGPVSIESWIRSSFTFCIADADHETSATMRENMPHATPFQEAMDDDLDFSSWMFQYSRSNMLPRILASSEKFKIDYNVLSVAAMSLALIMMVEYMRHLLDHQAKNRPFFRVVLDGVYAECTFP
jgi:hypothetical protein